MWATGGGKVAGSGGVATTTEGRWGGGPRVGVVLGGAVGVAVAWLAAPAIGGGAVFGAVALKAAILLVGSAIVMRLAGGRVGELGVRRPERWRGAGILLVVAVPFAVALTRVPQVHAVYPILGVAREDPWWLVPSTVAFASYGLGWELFFRGLLLLALVPRFGRLAILLQAVPCAALHFGKPPVEVAAALPAAIVLGALAFETRSIVPGWLLHTAVSLAVNLACVFWPL
jgi:hypothetical protein